MRTRARNALVAGVSLVAVTAVGTVWATGSAAAQHRYVTAAASTGEITQSYLATGTVSRQNLVDAGFSVSGTVRKLKVGVGDQVAAGDVLATLDTTALKLALLNAQTDLAGAKATLYAAEHPSSASSGSRGSGSPSLPSSGSSGSASDPSVPSGISAADAATLYQAIAAVNVATQKWSNPTQPTTCDAIHTALLNANQQTTTPPAEPGGDGGAASPEPQSPTTDPAPTDPGTTDPGTSDPGTSDPGTGETSDAGTDAPPASADPSGSPEAGGSDTPAPTPTANEPADQTGAGSPTAEPGAEAEQLALVVDAITLDDIRACGQAREDLLLATAVLTDYYQQLITTGSIAGSDQTPSPTTTPSPTATAGGGSRTGSGSSAGTTVSARAVASAEADVLRAQQAVDAAETELANAELVAPIAGTVGAISLTAGGSSSGGTITIVGDGTALVSIEVPLATRTLLSQGLAATVTPAGATASLPGTVSSISLLETSGTAGDAPTYTTVIAVDDPGQVLKEGAKAGVEIVTGTASGVVTVPASAVTPTGSGTGTVQVVGSASSDTAETVTVPTGAVGGGRVEITDGLEEGQLVVLSDRTLSIDSLTTSSTSSRRVAGFAVPR